MRILKRTIFLLLTSGCTLFAQNSNISLTTHYAFNGNGSKTTTPLTATLNNVSATSDRCNNHIPARAFSDSTTSYVHPNSPLNKPTTSLSGVGTGEMDKLHFYNRKLSASQDAALYSTDPSFLPTIATNALFTAPDTVCINQSFSPQNLSTGTISSYYWNACSSTAAPNTLTNSVAFGNPPFYNPVYMTHILDNGKHYLFVNNHVSNELFRLDFGASLSNTPNITNLGPIASGGNGEGIQIIKIGTTWFGLTVGNNSGPVLNRLNFGTSITNTPTITMIGNVGNLIYPHGLQLFTDGGNYYAFVSNYSGNSISRLDFGNTLANTPTGVNFNAFGSFPLNGPNDMALISSGGNWHLFVTNNGNNSITRLDFGTSLLNIPTPVNLGNPGNLLNAPRAISLSSDCNGITGYVSNYIDNKIHTITAPTATSALTIGNAGIAAGQAFAHDFEKVREGDTTFIFIANATGHSITKMKFATCHTTPSSTLQSPSFSFSSPGTYTLNLATNENLFDQSAICKKIVAIGGFVVSATASSTFVCGGKPIVLSASGANSYIWYPGNQTGSSVTVTPSSTTIYTVVGAKGTCTAMTTITVTALPGSTVNVIISPASICVGMSSSLTATGALTYTWQPGNLTGNSQVVSPAATTIYSVSGTTSLGCISGKTIALTVTAYPNITFDPSSAVVCSGTSATITAHGAASYSWLPGNMTTAVVVVAPSANTIYTVTGNTNNCVSTNTIMVTTAISPTVTLSLTSQSVCPGSPATISATGASSYTWFPGNYTGSIINVTPSVTTIYTVTGNNGSCVAQDRTVHIEVIEPATYSLSGPDVICSGQSLTVTANGLGAFNWVPGNLSGKTVVLSPTISTVYQVLQTGGNGCNFNSTFTVTVYSCDGPLFGITDAASTPLLQHGNYYLINFTVVAVNNSPVNLNKVRLYTDLASTFPSPCTYTVLNAPRILSHNSALVADNSFDGRTNLNITSVSASTMAPNKRDTIQLSVLVAPNGFYGPVENSVLGTAESAAGFSFADSSNNGFLWDPDKDGDPTNNNDVTVIEIKKIELFIPEGFSPNGDGKYDEFVIKGMQGRKAKLLIFNRWGSKVYEDEGTDLRWDGKAHFGLVVGNELVPPSTYYYILQYSDGQKESMNGFVEVKY